MTIKKYLVSLPITGVVCVEVQAASEEEAIDVALASDFSLNEVHEWEAHREITRGNIFCGMQNDADAREIS